MEALLAIVGASFEEHTPALADIQQPTLILWGAEDAWIPVEHAYRFDALLPNSQLIIYPRVGHIPMEEIPEQSVQDLLAFLQKHQLNPNEG